MKLSELLEELMFIYEEFGDIDAEIITCDENGELITSPVQVRLGTDENDGVASVAFTDLDFGDEDDEVSETN